MLAFLAVLAAAVVALFTVQELDVECGSKPTRRQARIKHFEPRHEGLGPVAQTR